MWSFHRCEPDELSNLINPPVTSVTVNTSSGSIRTVGALSRSCATFVLIGGGGVHIFFLIGLRNRLIVALGWLWCYFTSERGARSITGSGDEL
jgi:hypothetical protein